jgi:dTDP-4-dehydrorhamnose 3,5-epimerase
LKYNLIVILNYFIVVTLLFQKTPLKDLIVIEPEKIEDNRGFFARTWDQEIFREMNLNSKIIQCSISNNKKKGTLRGLHLQYAPYEEAKIIRCTRGKLFDIVVDLRKNSSTFKKWFSIELSSDNYKMLYVPEGCAHGYQTLEDNTEATYQITELFKPEYSGGIRWDDPALNIKLPLEISIISKKDMAWDFI